MPTAILNCGCDWIKGKPFPAAKYQDTIYGKGMRVHNRLAGVDPKFRCTICRNERGAPGSTEKAKKTG